MIYHAPADLTAQTANLSPEEQAKEMEEWMQWAQKCGDKLVDLGAPLAGGQELIPGGKIKASHKDVTGYSILQAENMNEAKSLLQGHPHLMWNAACSIEVHETIPLPEM